MENKPRLSEKEKYYFERTMRHIRRVQENAEYLIVNFSDELGLCALMRRSLALNVTKHDSSKFGVAQFQPYVDFSWAKRNGVDDKLQDEAWIDHYLTENHHPERLGGLGVELDIEVIEMACDLQAMAQEFGEVSGRGYFEKAWIFQQREHFKNWPRAKKIIEKCLDCFERGQG